MIGSRSGRNPKSWIACAPIWHFRGALDARFNDTTFVLPTIIHPFHLIFSALRLHLFHGLDVVCVAGAMNRMRVSCPSRVREILSTPMFAKPSALTWLPVILIMAGPGLSGQTSRSVWDGVYTREQATRGALTSGLCTQCHGDSFQGDPAPPLTGADFLAKWDGRSVGDLFELIRQTMPDDDPGSLTGQQYADLLAYIFSLNKFPAGTTELASSAEPLKQIRFTAEKP